MKKTLMAVLAAATIAVSLAGSTNDASAWRRGWRGPAFFGGLAAGAIVAGALARPYYYGYGYGPGYYDGPAYYYAPGPAYYYAPAPVEYEVYPTQPYPSCWRLRRGYRYYVC